MCLLYVRVYAENTCFLKPITHAYFKIHCNAFHYLHGRWRCCCCCCKKKIECINTKLVHTETHTHIRTQTHLYRHRFGWSGSDISNSPTTNLPPHRYIHSFHWFYSFFILLCTQTHTFNVRMHTHQFFSRYFVQSSILFTLERTTIKMCKNIRNRPSVQMYSTNLYADNMYVYLSKYMFIS